jgi:putative toxin-antitoxin system antitoxin component (TIGR02293 family)
MMVVPPEILQRATEVLGSLEHAQYWLESRLPVLDGRRPVDVITDPGGAAELLDILVRIEHGVFS